MTDRDKIKENRIKLMIEKLDKELSDSNRYFNERDLMDCIDRIKDIVNKYKKLFDAGNYSEQ